MKKATSDLDPGGGRGRHHLLLSSRVVEWKCRMFTVGQLKLEGVYVLTVWEAIVHVL